MSDIVLKKPVNPKYIRTKLPYGTYADGTPHRGIDYGHITWPFPIAASREIRAAARGRVVYVYGGGKDNDGWGNLIIIQHTSVAFTAYAHFKTGTSLVEVGDVVEALELIATMGATGDTGGTTHLHFELRLNGRQPGNRVDPAPYFKKALPGTAVVPAPKPATVEVYTNLKVALAPVNMRSAPSTKGTVVTVVPKGGLVRTAPSKDGWSKARRGTKKGYIKTEYAVMRTKKVLKDGLWLRAAPGSEKVLAKLKLGTKVTVLAASGKTSASDWWKVKVGTKTGWVLARYVR